MPPVHQSGVRVLHDAEDEGDEASAFPLPANLDLKAAAALLAGFLERRGTDIVIDAGAVQRLGGQCLQILLVAQAGWAADKRELRFENASPEFRAAAELFGAADILFQDRKS